MVTPCWGRGCNAGQNLWQKLGNPAGLNIIENILLPSNIFSAPPPNINVEVIAPLQTNTSRTTLKFGRGEVLKCHHFYSRIHSMMFLPNYFFLYWWVEWLCPAGGEGELHGYSPLGERVGCMVTPHWGRGWVAWLLTTGGEGGLHGYFPLGKFVLWLLPTGRGVGCMVTFCWESWFHGYYPLGGVLSLFYGYSPLAERGWIAWLLPAGREGGLHGYFPLVERVGCMVTPCWDRGWVAWLLSTGGEGGLHGYSPLESGLTK